MRMKMIGNEKMKEGTSRGKMGRGRYRRRLGM